MIDDTSAHPDDERRPDTVCIEIPAQGRFVALTRVAVASLAADLDPVINDVEDLRVAVNELVGLLVEAADGGHVVLRLWNVERTIHVAGHCTDSTSRVVPDQLTQRILDATVDGYDVSDGAFRMHKHLDAV